MAAGPSPILGNFTPSNSILAGCPDAAGWNVIAWPWKSLEPDLIRSVPSYRGLNSTGRDAKISGHEERRNLPAAITLCRRVTDRPVRLHCVCVLPSGAPHPQGIKDVILHVLRIGLTRDPLQGLSDDIDSQVGVMEPGVGRILHLFVLDPSQHHRGWKLLQGTGDSTSKLPHFGDRRACLCFEVE